MRELQHKRPRCVWRNLGLPKGARHPNPYAWTLLGLYTLKPQATAVSAPDYCVDCPFPFAHSGLTISSSLFWRSSSASYTFFSEDPWFLTLWLPPGFQVLFQGHSLPQLVSGPMGISPLASPHGQNHKYRNLLGRAARMWTIGQVAREERNYRVNTIFLRWQQEIWTKGSGSAGGCVPNQVLVMAAAV